MTSLSDHVPTGRAFLALPLAAAAVHVAQVARGKSERGTFRPSELLMKRGPGTGYAAGDVPAYHDVTTADLAAHTDAVLHHMVLTGQVVPCYTGEGEDAGKYRVITSA
jgi:hypothetical protein